ncbi:MAG: enoyl-CoA hydratase-related protein, partial [bacterium]
MTVKISNHSINSYTWQNWHIFRPERLNALGTTIAKELADTLEFARDQLAPEVRAVVITAETVVKSGLAYWVAGGDLKELSTLDQKHQAHIYAQTMRRFCEGLETLPVPVI